MKLWSTPLGMVLLTTACGGTQVCGFDRNTTTSKLYQGSSHAHIWSELIVDWRSARLQGRVSQLVEGKQRVTPIDQPIADATLAGLRDQLGKTCGALSTVTEPSEMGGGSPYLSVTSSAGSEFRIVAPPYGASPGTKVLEVSGPTFEALRDAFPKQPATGTGSAPTEATETTRPRSDRVRTAASHGFGGGWTTRDPEVPLGRSEAPSTSTEGSSLSSTCAPRAASSSMANLGSKP